MLSLALLCKKCVYLHEFILCVFRVYCLCVCCFLLLLYFLFGKPALMGCGLYWQPAIIVT